MQIKKIFSSLSNLEKIVSIGALILILLTGAVKFALYIEANTTIVPAKGGEFREGLVGQPVFINPVIPTTAADREIAKVVFGNLKDITESATHSADGKTWTVRIRQNVLWQDGKPVTSDDVVFTFGVIKDQSNRSPLFSSFQGVNIERVSELEIKFILQTSYALFEEETLNNLYIIPKHIFADSEIQNAIRLSIYGLKPIGFGPYRVDSYDKDDRGVINTFYLSANPNYFKGEPNITNLIFKFYRNEKELIDAYKSGRIDGFGLGNASMILENPINIRHKIYGLQSSSYYAFFINLASENKDLRTLRVREAMSKTLDQAAIAKAVFGEYALPLYGPTPLTPKDTDDFNKELLKGVKLNVTLPDEPFLVKTAELAKSAWALAGAEVNLRIVPISEIEDILKKTDYEILLFGNVPGPSGDLFSFWHSSQRFFPGNNLTLYQNRRADQLIEAFGKEYDSERRQDSLKQLSDLIAADYPAIFLYSPQYIYVSTPRLKGFDIEEVMNIASDRFNKIENWHLKTNRVF